MFHLDFHWYTFDNVYYFTGNNSHISWDFHQVVRELVRSLGYYFEGIFLSLPFQIAFMSQYVSIQLLKLSPNVFLYIYKLRINIDKVSIFDREIGLESVKLIPFLVSKITYFEYSVLVIVYPQTDC